MNLLLRSEVGAAQSGRGGYGTMAPNMRFSYVGVSVVLSLPWNPHLSSTPINASPITAAASYHLPITLVRVLKIHLRTWLLRIHLRQYR